MAWWGGCERNHDFLERQEEHIFSKHRESKPKLKCQHLRVTVRLASPVKNQRVEFHSDVSKM